MSELTGAPSDFCIDSEDVEDVPEGVHTTVS